MGDKDLGRALRQANKAAAEVIAEEARRQAPVRTGRLRSSIRAQATQKGASVKAGSPARVPYASVIHWGWQRRNIAPNPFISRAIERRIDEARAAYAEALDELAARLSTTIRSRT
ncbi:MAG: hypothetical protein D6683_17865 [Actinomyces sp.]|nr:MAG: hypothetical protein D6683_17865 [Actinomyces sp.]